MTNFKYVGLSAVLLLANPAFADGPAFAGRVVPVLPVMHVAPAVTNDWSGFYAGGMVSFDSADGEIIIYSNGAPVNAFTANTVTSFGGFAGYNFQLNNFVLGGEAAISSGGIGATVNPNIHYETFYDLKARVGYSVGKALPYAVLGYSIAHLDAVTNQVPSAGLTYGAGVDYMINDHIFVGAEYLIRDMEGTSQQSPLTTIETTIQSAQLRVGWKF